MPSRSGAARWIALAAGLLGAAVFLVIGAIAAGYIRRHGFDWSLALPLIPPAATVLFAAVLLRARLSGALGRVLSGVAALSVLYLALMAIVLGRHYALIANDGTAYWGYLILPAAWVWPLALCGGAVLGAGAYYLGRVLRAG